MPHRGSGRHVHVTSQIWVLLLPLCTYTGVLTFRLNLASPPTLVFQDLRSSPWDPKWRERAPTLTPVPQSPAPAFSQLRMGLGLRLLGVLPVPSRVQLKVTAVIPYSCLGLPQPPYRQRVWVSQPFMPKHIVFDKTLACSPAGRAPAALPRLLPPAACLSSPCRSGPHPGTLRRRVRRSSPSLTSDLSLPGSSKVR